MKTLPISDCELPIVAKRYPAIRANSKSAFCNWKSAIKRWSPYVLGLLFALAFAKVLSSLLIGISGYDVTTLVVVLVLLTGVAFVASYLPARRATKVDPSVALRYE